MTKTFTAKFGSTTATRTSEHDYAYASIKREPYSGWVIRFHKTYSAAIRRGRVASAVARTEVQA